MLTLLATSAEAGELSPAEYPVASLSGTLAMPLASASSIGLQLGGDLDKRFLSPEASTTFAGGVWRSHHVDSVDGSLLIFGERNNALMPVERASATSLDPTPQAYLGLRLVLRDMTEDDINSKVFKRRAGGTHAEFEGLKRSVTPLRVHIGLRVGLLHDTKLDRASTASAAADVVVDYSAENFAGFVGASAGLNRGWKPTEPDDRLGVRTTSDFRVAAGGYVPAGRVRFGAVGSLDLIRWNKGETRHDLAADAFLFVTTETSEQLDVAVQLGVRREPRFPGESRWLPYFTGGPQFAF
jgi:hypothetical protein